MMNAIKNITVKLLNSSKFSIDGLVAVWRNEQSFRLESYVSLVAVLMIIVIPFGMIEKLLLVLMMLFLLVSELFNSAVEAVVDRISLDVHPLSKIAKDACSAAVAIAILMNIITWIFLLIDLYY